MKIWKLTLFWSLIFCSVVYLHPAGNDSLECKYNSSLERILKIQKEINSIHPALAKVYPVAIVNNGDYCIFDIDSTGNYKLIKTAHPEISVPDGVRAAFPLKEYDYRMVCVVTVDVFDSVSGYATIFHEFVHCYQFETMEMQLKEQLAIYKDAMQNENWMWELNFPFPYDNKEFEKEYSQLITKAWNNDTTAFDSLRKLKKILSPEQFEYMTWVMWKEGSARRIENKIRVFYNADENHAGKDKPFSRVTFYEGGAAMFNLVESINPDDVNNLEAFYKKLTEL